MDAFKRWQRVRTPSAIAQPNNEVDAQTRSEKLLPAEAARTRSVAERRTQMDMDDRRGGALIASAAEIAPSSQLLQVQWRIPRGRTATRML